MRGDGSSKRPRIRRKPGSGFDVYIHVLELFKFNVCIV